MSIFTISRPLCMKYYPLLTCYDLFIFNPLLKMRKLFLFKAFQCRQMLTVPFKGMVYGNKKKNTFFLIWTKRVMENQFKKKKSYVMYWHSPAPDPSVRGSFLGKNNLNLIHTYFFRLLSKLAEIKFGTPSSSSIYGFASYRP